MDMDVKTVMDTWTLQMGFPVITVTRFVDSLNCVMFEPNPFLPCLFSGTTTPVQLMCVRADS